MSLLTDIKQNFIYTNHAVKRLIALNVVVFLVLSLLNVIVNLSQSSLSIIQITRVFTLRAYFPDFIKQPWSLITHMFLHAGPMHLVLNMIWLYWMGNLFHEYLGNKRVYQAYLLGGIFGGLMFMLGFNVFPLFDSIRTEAFALGASAGVLSVTVAVATLLPNYEIKLLFIGFVKLKWIALVVVVLDLISVSGNNAGGHIGHLGGAIFGFMYIKYLYKHTFFDNIPNRIRNLFKKKSKLKVHYKTTFMKTGDNQKPTEHEVDLILDKINKSGYDSLSKTEKEQLFKASKD